jgi:hypothetical protein
MAQKFARSDDFKTPECRASYAFNMFKSRLQTKDDGTTKEQWGVTLIFLDQFKPVLEKIVGQVIIEQWGEKGIERAKQGLIKSPFLSGTGKEARAKETGELHPGMGEGLFFIRPNANKAPAVHWKSPVIPATEADVYSGCYGFAVLNAYAWNNVKNGDGVSFGLQYFQKTKEGDRIGGSGGVDPSKWHEKIEDAGDAPDETKSGAGAGGLFG